jgi:hypothetical protein
MNLIIELITVKVLSVMIVIPECFYRESRSEQMAITSAY